MLNHVSIGVRDVAAAATFYDTVMSALGYRRVADYLPQFVAYGTDSPVFWVGKTHDGRDATNGNGCHFCFDAPSKNAVHRFYEAALAAGGQDDGPPGLRPEYMPDYYAAFVRDLDGNKIEAVFMPMPEMLKTSQKKATKTKSALVKTAKKNGKKTKMVKTKAKAKATAPAKKAARVMVRSAKPRMKTKAGKTRR